MSNKIIVCNVFVGGFGMDRNNLPNEVINFYRADDNDIYIYLPPHGKLPDCVRNLDEIKGILFVRTAGDGYVEVLGKATEIMEYYADVLDKSTCKQSEKAAVIAKREEICKKMEYGGMSWSCIQAQNKDHDEVTVSCKVKTFCLPKKTFYLSPNDSASRRSDLRSKSAYFVTEGNGEKGKKMNSQSMRAIYVDEGDTKNQYKILENVIGCAELWCDASETPRYDCSSVSFDDDNIFKAARQQDKEVVFSNMLYHFLSNYGEILESFVREVLDLKEVDPSGCLVEREKGRVDLKISKENEFCIIIENKIKSTINGVVESGCRDDGVESQLSKYYAEAFEKYGEGNVYGFLLHPDYTQWNEEVQKLYRYGNKYESRTYSQVREWFNEFANDKYPFAVEFYKAMYKHTTDTDCEFRDEILKRFAQRIKNRK